MGVGNGRSAEYSRGVRQRIAALAKERRWREEHKIWVRMVLLLFVVI